MNKGKPETSFNIAKNFCPYFISDFFKKKRFLRKSNKPEHGNLVLITSTVLGELSKLNFNFDEIKSYFLQVLRQGTADK